MQYKIYLLIQNIIFCAKTEGDLGKPQRDRFESRLSLPYIQDVDLGIPEGIKIFAKI